MTQQLSRSSDQLWEVTISVQIDGTWIKRGHQFRGSASEAEAYVLDLPFHFERYRLQLQEGS